MKPVVKPTIVAVIKTVITENRNVVTVKCTVLPIRRRTITLVAIANAPPSEKNKPHFISG